MCHMLHSREFERRGKVISKVFYGKKNGEKCSLATKSNQITFQKSAFLLGSNVFRKLIYGLNWFVIKRFEPHFCTSYLSLKLIVMNRITTLLSMLFALGTFSSMNLVAQNCQSAAITHLNVNNVDALLPQGGRFWFDGTDAGYAVPKNDPNHVKAIFAGSLWMAGINSSGNIQIAAQTYGELSGENAGPLINGVQEPTICEQFNRFWEVSANEVAAHIADFSDNGIVDNPIPSILAWPGRDNPESLVANGFQLPQSMSLAPFFDFDTDGIYDPLDGDYPAIKGEQNIWWVFHSNGVGSDLSPVMTCQVLAYAASSSIEAINNATFYDVKFVYEGTENLQDFYAGLWIDPDLGCYTDDYVGCYPDEDFAFVYNTDAQDGSVGCNCDGGVATYCEEVPVLSIKMLNGLRNELGEQLGMTSFVAFNNAGIGNMPPGTTDPSIDFEYYNYMKGLWKDGTPITEGGNGYQSGGAVTTYTFQDSPADPNGWSMCTANLPPTDSRMLMSSGPVLMQPGAVNEISFAVQWVPNQQYPCPDVQPMVAAGKAAEEFSFILSQIQEPELLDKMVVASPNPANQTVTISSKGTATISSIELHSISGALLHKSIGNGSNQLNIERNGLTAGLYFYKATLSNGSVATGKLAWQ